MTIDVTRFPRCIMLALLLIAVANGKCQDTVSDELRKLFGWGPGDNHQKEFFKRVFEKHEEEIDGHPVKAFTYKEKLLKELPSQIRKPEPFHFIFWMENILGSSHNHVFVLEKNENGKLFLKQSSIAMDGQGDAAHGYEGWAIPKFEMDEWRKHNGKVWKQEGSYQVDIDNFVESLCDTKEYNFMSELVMNAEIDGRHTGDTCWKIGYGVAIFKKKSPEEQTLDETQAEDTRGRITSDPPAYDGIPTISVRRPSSPIHAVMAEIYDDKSCSVIEARSPTPPSPPSSSGPMECHSPSYEEVFARRRTRAINLIDNAAEDYRKHLNLATHEETVETDEQESDESGASLSIPPSPPASPRRR